MIPERLVIGTGNAGKVGELTRMVEAWGGAVVIESLAAHPDVAMPEETGETYEQNAALKAGVVAAATGLPALADDSGLEVDALGGQPGVHSARYGRDDADRIARLLNALAQRGAAERTARFRCVVVLAWPDGRVEMGEGTVEGRIVEAPRGEGGFGYDPVFRSDELGRTFAEVTGAEKASVSHRARAMAALGARLRA
jgi:XTP/dITP diphosphohydrolase